MYHAPWLDFGRIFRFSRRRSTKLNWPSIENLPRSIRAGRIRSNCGLADGIGKKLSIFWEELNKIKCNIDEHPPRKYHVQQKVIEAAEADIIHGVDSRMGHQATEIAEESSSDLDFTTTPLLSHSDFLKMIEKQLRGSKKIDH